MSRGGEGKILDSGAVIKFENANLLFAILNYYVIYYIRNFVYDLTGNY